MHIRWQDIGCPRAAGLFPCRAFLVLVKVQHIAVWDAYPGAVFVAEWSSGGQRSGVLTLTSWHVPLTDIRFI